MGKQFQAPNLPGLGTDPIAQGTQALGQSIASLPLLYEQHQQQLAEAKAKKTASAIDLIKQQLELKKLQQAGSVYDPLHGTSTSTPGLSPDISISPDASGFPALNVPPGADLGSRVPKIAPVIPQYVNQTVDENGKVIDKDILEPGQRPGTTTKPQTGGAANGRGFGNRILPAAQTDALADARLLRTQIESLNGLYSDKYVGLAKPIFGKSKQYLENTATEEGSNFYSTLATIKNTLLQLRSGKVINEHEYKRLIEELPDEYKAPKDFKARLNRFHTYFNSAIKTKIDTYQKAGYDTHELMDLVDDTQSSGATDKKAALREKLGLKQNGKN